MKLSQLTFTMPLREGETSFCMNYDASDRLRQINNQDILDEVKDKLISVYGDMDITIDPKAAWYDRVRIDDERWNEDYRKFTERKQAWCDKYGCD